MARLLLFNPENDIRLGEIPGKTPRRLTNNVVALGRDGALLPLWWADETDTVLVRCDNEAMFEQYLRKVKALESKFGLKANILYQGQRLTEECIGSPWGWSYDSANIMRQAGSISLTDVEVERIRQLSHRRTSIIINNSLRGLLSFPLPASAKECHTMSEVISFLRENNGGYIKAPWSSSGRGVIKIDKEPDEKTCVLIESFIRRQSSVICEHMLNGVQDFAMLFYCENGLANYKGLSIFNTRGGTTYSGNIVDDDDRLHDIIVHRGVEANRIDQLKEALLKVLTEHVAPYYMGWLGIDMLVTADGLVAPCIELNLRMTMGVVAWYLARRLPKELLPSLYSVAINDKQNAGISIIGAEPDSKFNFTVSTF
ncbi:MAG: hypothetical protein NC343_01685 [Muribaculum sp.]|nr:hypothetical protein [Muribaculaceae bacterium]MCM1080446.1 hypothetical protein [Muribaculum sp.]